MPQSTTPEYFFPFDQYELEFTVSLNSGFSRFQDEDFHFGIFVRPDVYLELSAPEWDAVAYAEASDNGLQERIRILLKRPPAIRNITVILLATILIVILMLIRVPSIGSVLEISVAVIFSLWGVQTLLIPDYLEGTTIVHNILRALYVILAFTLFTRFVLLPAWYRASYATENASRDAKSSKPFLPQSDASEPIATAEDSAIQPRSVQPHSVNTAFLLIVGLLTGLGVSLTLLRLFEKLQSRRKNSKS